MSDIVLGMGEVGETLFGLLDERNFDCVGIDIESSKCKIIQKIVQLKIQNIFMFVYQENYQDLWILL